MKPLNAEMLDRPPTLGRLGMLGMLWSKPGPGPGLGYAVVLVVGTSPSFTAILPQCQIAADYIGTLGCTLPLLCIC